ncbi:MAG: AAA family ATPase [Candidatus Caldarchaeum sp.]|nr:AAA family ATPase [Candidatus Caldarchaeum sp.]
MSGTPGVGKTTVGKQLAKKLGYKFLDIPAFVKEARIGKRVGAADYLDVDLRILKQKLSQQVEDNTVVSGHLVVRLPRKQQKCIVLRRNPLKLAEGLKKRGYSMGKIVENVEAEFLGIVYDEAVKTFGRGRVYQVDTTGRKSFQITANCLRIVRMAGVGDDVDWFRDLGKKELDRLLLFLARGRRVVL